jgi:hypothetical protein
MATSVALGIGGWRLRKMWDSYDRNGPKVSLHWNTAGILLKQFTPHMPFCLASVVVHLGIRAVDMLARTMLCHLYTISLWDLTGD